MNSINELSWNELNHSYQPSEFLFHTIDEVEDVRALIDQDEVIDAIRRGLQIESKGYNLYICGVANSQMEDIVIEEIKKIAQKKPCPKVTSYIYNFDEPEKPKLVELENRVAKELKADLAEWRAFILNDIPILLDEDEVKDKQEAIIAEFGELSEKYLMDIEEQARQSHIQLKKTEEGISFMPINEQGEAYNKEEFLNLDTTLQSEIIEKIKGLQVYSSQIMEFLQKKEEEYRRLYNEIEQEVILREIGKNIKKLQEKYKKYTSLIRYFNGMAEEILEHLDYFSAVEEDALLIRQELERMVRNYDINLLNIPKTDDAPVINDMDYMQVGVAGNILLDIENNAIQSNFLNIRPGLVALANGGYLILHMQELIEKASEWQKLKRILRTGKISIEGNEEVGITLSRTLKPQPIPVSCKVIIIGNQNIYELLKEYDESFQKLFKVKVVFKDEMEMDALKFKQLAGWIKVRSREEGLKPVTTEGLLRILEYGYRQMGHVARISSDLEWIMDILREAEEASCALIDKKHIEECLKKRVQYEYHLKERLDESMKDGTYLIDTSGAKIGQINGLAVCAIDGLSFGRPLRITATTYKGKNGIIDIENEAKLSGSIHTKGIHIINGFLGNQFAQEIPLSLNCNICFEQSYAGVDGDSASSAELYAILSSLSEVPVLQSIAVTGSVNQFGEIQPVGGINEKIEGFYQVCKERGLTGEEGVMIPHKNMKELLLNKEVVDAVKEKKFHIYAITNIWEGVELMMQQKKEVVKMKIQEKLIRFNE